MNASAEIPAVAMIVFNRPDTTQRVFEAIRNARPRKLFIISDGPRPTRPGDAPKCEQVRRIVEQVDWDCDVRRNFAEQNMGCKRRVASGISWVFEHVEEAIILEDDCLPHPSFFPYCQQMLERFRDDPRVFAISGDNFLSGRVRTEYSYFYSQFIHIWGWATWRRSWKLYDPDMKLWPEVRDRGWISDLFPIPREASHWRRILQGTYQGDIDTWDYQVLFTSWLNHMLGVIPNRNMVSNLGFRADATHTGGRTPYAEKPLEAMDFPLKHPPFMLIDQQSDAITQEVFYQPPKMLERVRRRILRFAHEHRNGTEAEPGQHST